MKLIQRARRFIEKIHIRILQKCSGNQKTSGLTAGQGLRFLPPLTITREEMDKGLAILKATLS